jgi:hypothetical protein
MYVVSITDFTSVGDTVVPVESVVSAKAGVSFGVSVVSAKAVVAAKALKFIIMYIKLWNS